MTLLNNASLSMSNSSIVFSAQNAYTSMELYYAIVALFSIFIIASLFLDGGTKPFEKLFAAIVGFVFSVSIAISSFSLAIINVGEAGSLQQIAATAISQQKAITPMIIMQNSQTWQIISWIIVILCFVNIINCILVLIDYSRIKGVTKGAL